MKVHGALERIDLLEEGAVKRLSYQYLNMEKEN